MPSGPAPATLRKYFVFAGSLSGVASPSGISRTAATNKHFRRARNVPGQIQFFGENIGGATGKKRERDAVAIFLACKAVHDFVQQCRRRRRR